MLSATRVVFRPTNLVVPVMSDKADHPGAVLDGGFGVIGTQRHGFVTVGNDKIGTSTTPIAGRHR